jgi:hypothetical protein
LVRRNKMLKGVFMVARIFITLILGFAAFANAAPNMNTIYVQGYLKRSNGSPATDGTYSMAITIRSGATAFWTKTINVPVSNGFFSQALTGASSAPHSGNIDSATISQAAAGALVIGVQTTIDSQSVSFDVQASPTPLALVADTALNVSANAVNSAAIAAGAVTNAKIATAAVGPANLAASGTMPAWNGSALTNISAANIVGTLPGSSFPATLPASNGSNLTNIAASAISGNLAAGNLPALSGDVSSSAGSAAVTVNKIKGVNVDLTGIANGQVLKYNGSDFVPFTLPAGSDISGKADITYVDAQLANKADNSSVSSQLALKADASSLTWANISGKPSAFSPDAHSHAIADVTNLQTNLDSKLSIAKLSLNCNPDQTVQYISVSDSYQCQSIQIASGQITGLSAVATSGAYADISGKPTLAAVATSGAYADISGKPTFATVATSGSYADLSAKPDLTLYAQKASNLSDLSNAAAARTNLGLGSAAVKNAPAAGDAAAAEVVLGNDSRLSDSRAPMGAAGGDLSGSYPNPTLINVGTAGTYAQVTTDANGRVTSGVATLPLANGGTGATTQAGAANAILPAQAGNAGEVLMTDGTNAAWGFTMGGQAVATNVVVGNTGAASNTTIQAGSTGKVTIGASGAGAVAFSAMGACTIASFNANGTGATAYTNKTCTGVPTGAAIHCNPTSAYTGTISFSATVTAANTVALRGAAGSPAIGTSSWVCMWMKP